MNNELDWTDNTDAIYKKGQSRLFLLGRLRSFGIQGALLRNFFDTVVASVIFYGVVCWCRSISTADKKRLDKLIRKASSVLGMSLDTVEEVGEWLPLSSYYPWWRTTPIHFMEQFYPWEVPSVTDCYIQNVWSSATECLFFQLQLDFMFLYYNI